MTQRLYGVLIISAILFACASVSELKKEHLFEETMKVYSQAIRWSDFETIYGFRKIDEKFDPSQLDKFKEIRITGYEVQQIIMEDKSHVKQLVEIQYYRTGEMKERTLRGHQSWEFDEALNRWYLVEDLSFDF